MSTSIAGPVAALINEFSKLPTVGPKTAARLVFYLLNRPRNEAQALAEAIVEVKDRVRFCSSCFSLTESDPCALCTDERRDATTICVVAEAKDVYAVERTGAYRGRYHVLGGLISPMDGIGPAQLRVKELIERVGARIARRNHPGDQSQCRRRSDRALSFAAAPAAGRYDLALGLRPADRRRSRLRRRGHAGEGPRRPHDALVPFWFSTLGVLRWFEGYRPARCLRR